MLKKQIPLISLGVLLGLWIVFPAAGSIVFMSVAMLAMVGWLFMGAPSDAPQEGEA